MEITRTTDPLGRDTGFSLAGADYGVTYAYDAYGRFQSVTSARSMRPRSGKSEDTFTYSYLPDSDLLSGTTSSSGFLWTRAYESARSLITSVENRIGETVISRYDYANDELGRRTLRADSGLAFAVQPTLGDSATVEMPAYNAYSYNTRSEVTGAARRWGTPGASGDLVLGQQYAYEFDPIGNRITSAEGDTARSASYTANAMNQYTQRTVPDEKDLIGTAPTNVAVTVNAAAVTRQNAYWHHALEVTNVTSAAYPQVAITAVYNPPGTNDPDVVTAQTGRVFVAKTPESFQYDSDGNLTQDGRFNYTWNGENRLIQAETRDNLPAAVPRVKVEYAYDHQGRMVWKEIKRRGAEAQSWEVEQTANLLWDGYNIIAEKVGRAVPGEPLSVTTNHYVWGLDLSGTLQGAGGVGGLLAEIKDGVSYFAAFDANGNVTEYLGADGAPAAHYEYSPFGEIVVQSGDLADSFTHRFSTKPWCAVTGLSEYLFRKYGPGMGRWLSRDPMGEMGSIHYYSFSGNSPIVKIDAIGLFDDNRRPVPIIIITLPGFGVQLPPISTPWPSDPQYPPPPSGNPSKSPCPTTPEEYHKCTPCNQGDIKGKRQNREYNNEKNGCGPFKPILWVIPGGWVPDNPSGLPGCSFTSACDNHDCCFGHCGTTQKECDGNFKNQMLSICQKCTSNVATRTWCEMWAGIYAWAVSGGTGGKAHDKSQIDACEECCCP